MKKLLLSAGLLLAMNLSFAGTAIKTISSTNTATVATSIKTMPEIKVTYAVASCTASASIGVGANKIEISATAATCKEAIAMIKAVMQ